MTLNLYAPQGGVLAAMGGFEETLTAQLDGRGDWKAWNGNLTANLGAAPLARVALTGRDGTFSVQATALASRLLTGTAAELLGTETAIELTARLQARKAAIDGRPPDRKRTRLNSSDYCATRMPSSDIKNKPHKHH